MRRGWAPIPIPIGEKAPHPKHWEQSLPTEADIPNYFNAQQNIGMPLGKPSGGLIDLDLDAPETIRLAPQFLLRREAIFGRASKPTSHFLARQPDRAGCTYQRVGGLHPTLPRRPVHLSQTLPVFRVAGRLAGVVQEG